MTDSNTKTCAACGGKGTVLSADFELRPCSRCRAGAFHDWYEVVKGRYFANKLRQKVQQQKEGQRD